MESVEDIINKVPTPPQSMEKLRLNPRDKIYSRNPKTDIVEEGWEVVGIDSTDPNKRLVHLQKEGARDRTQTEQELIELNMLFAKGTPGEPSQAQTPQTPEEFDALSKKVEELLQ